MEQLEDVKKRMKSIENYFEQNSIKNALFKPEYEAAKRINSIAFSRGELDLRMEKLSKSTIKQMKRRIIMEQVGWILGFIFKR